MHLPQPCLGEGLGESYPSDDGRGSGRRQGGREEEDRCPGKALSQCWVCNKN